ncbi:DUF418 domain-containing protein [Bacillus sonorensis]|uniref:DUF418 domain-containing protein n=1 Tax=Bacillus sonorensis TaxID=119858 RepID=UPI0018CFA395|nr:DUF418 domain-containing protein [Bacillus sonorensis]MCF7616078.1 DUF418 domain-containing protein [Bacillus sonorensis]MCY7857995.1 DUF418 domain-containing protein [Bacillus sonorensis]MCY8023903.1 DUF418 domain-containing protein [Bacillus sonorensis]MCY8033267.1 DUF418 domain-containing protein [Bacillus sonorensis]MCY8089036.1 DUF418 domain-containing protein [Bacillus sonorensis]
MDTQRLQVDRMIWLDQARGIALFGILLANMLLFQYGMWEDLAFKPLASYDHWAYEWTRIFAVGSFMPLFAFLFGYGMVLMRDRLEQRGMVKYRRVFMRRFLLLAVFGYLHSYFIWDGDILLSYGIVGIVLLFLFINRQPKTILIWAVSLFAVYVLMCFGSGGVEPDSELTAFNERTAEVMQGGSYWEIVSHRANDVVPLFDFDDSLPEWMAGGLSFLLLMVLAPFFTLPPFLIGLYAAKKKWLHQPRLHVKGIRRAFFAALTIGAPLKALPLVWSDPAVYMLSEGVGPLALTCCYVTGIMLLTRSAWGQRVLKPFGAVGRLSLTNYLMQSIVMTSVFYGYGLGLYGKLGVLAGIGIAVLLFLCQMAASMWWIKRFRIGPFEWLWRLGTYLKPPAFIKRNMTAKGHSVAK